MIYLIAWRNIWRNRGRSLVVVIAMILGICATVFITGFSWGMYEYRIEELIRSEVSHVQVHHAEFLENYETKYTIPNSDKILEDLKQDERVDVFAPRVVGMGMLMSSRGQTGALVQGIDTALEDLTTGLKAKLVEGEYFTGTKAKPIVMSKRMLETLKLELGQRVTLKVDHHPGVRYKIVGVYNTTNALYDELNVFVLDKHLRGQLQIPNGLHEVAVKLKDDDEMSGFISDLKSDVPANAKVESWKQIMPEIAVGIDSFNTSILIIVLIIFLGVAFGIVNTMLMAVLERVREIGMLLAIGMTRTRVFTMIMIETLFLALAGAPLGLFFGYLLILFTGNVGIDLSMMSEGIEGMGFNSVVYPALELKYYLQITSQIIIIVFIASLFPAFRARKLNPAEAIRKM